MDDFRIYAEKPNIFETFPENFLRDCVGFFSLRMTIWPY